MCKNLTLVFWQTFFKYAEYDLSVFFFCMSVLYVRFVTKSIFRLQLDFLTSLNNFKIAYLRFARYLIIISFHKFWERYISPYLLYEITSDLAYMVYASPVWIHFIYGWYWQKINIYVNYFLRLSSLMQKVKQSFK